ncbi:sigma-70 family RNA polymerase sigma factor [Nonomuraea sp. NPDC052265]|uniref:sigma-70 family RNA polymerase sigma factor n=1 Tax=Nonomuraea sp. NPDC052265 TaxID=3364374 RepID=UPI0037C61108
MSQDVEPSDQADSATQTFLTHRNLLFTVAYEMLGSAADAEDILQETWLRWASIELEEVRDRRAFLVRMVTRQALTRLRTLRRRKESYVGPWLPEPLPTSPDVAEDVELAESVSMAMPLVLETLHPTERAVFVLREVFGLDYDEIAEAGQEVFHLHLHVVPRYAGDGVVVGAEWRGRSRERLDADAALIRAAPP